MSKKEKIKILEKESTIKIGYNLDVIEWELPNKEFNCDIYLEDNVILESHCLLNLNGINGSIHIHSKNNNVVNISLGLSLNKENNIIIKNSLDGNSSYSKIILHVVQEDNNKSTLKTVGLINEKTIDNEFLEQIKVLNLKDEKITCLPELLVYSNEAIANHSATIRSISDDELFYLNSKGIDNENAKEIIVKGFLESMLNR